MSVDIEVNDARPPHVIVAERLQRLAAGAANIAAQLEATNNIIDAEVVESSGEPVREKNSEDPTDAQEESGER